MGKFSRLFVYGIFLDERRRNSYGMINPEYATVPDYVTQGRLIVKAIPVDSKFNLALTGLIVDVPNKQWINIDRLEGGYDRVEVMTTDNERCYMYVTPGTVGARKEE